MAAKREWAQQLERESDRIVGPEAEVTGRLFEAFLARATLFHSFLLPYFPLIFQLFSAYEAANNLLILAA